MALWKLSSFLFYLCISSFLDAKCRVAFLPQKLFAPDEWSRVLAFPPHHIAPLVELQGKVSMALDPFRKTVVHDCLAARSDGNRHVQLHASRLGNPCNNLLLVLRGCCKLPWLFCFFSFFFFFFHILLLAQQFLRHKEREVSILNTHGPHLGVQEALDRFPDRVAPWAKDVTARDLVVLDELPLHHHIFVPFLEIFLILLEFQCPSCSVSSCSSNRPWRSCCCCCSRSFPNFHNLSANQSRGPDSCRQRRVFFIQQEP